MHKRAPRGRQRAPRGPQEGTKKRQEALAPPWTLCKTVLWLQWRSFWPQAGPREHQEGGKWGLRSTQEAPGEPHEGAKEPQEGAGAPDTHFCEGIGGPRAHPGCKVQPQEVVTSHFGGPGGNLKEGGNSSLTADPVTTRQPFADSWSCNCL